VTTFNEPTGEAWVRTVNRRLAQLERIPHAATVSASDLTADTSVTFEADVLMSSGTTSDPSLSMQDTETRLFAEEDSPLDPFMHEEYDEIIPVEAQTDLSYAPVTPTDPIIEPRATGVAVIWDGEGAGGEAIPVNLLLVEVHRSLDPTFTPDQATYCGSFLDAGLIDFNDQTFDIPWYYRFVLLTNDGRRSTPSNPVEAIARRLSAEEVGFSAGDIDHDGAIGSAGTTRNNYATNPRLLNHSGGVFAEWVGVVWIIDGGSPAGPQYSNVDGGSPSDTGTGTLDGGTP
jgi:hypothetical protein